LFQADSADVFSKIIPSAMLKNCRVCQVKKCRGTTRKTCVLGVGRVSCRAAYHLPTSKINLEYIIINNDNHHHDDDDDDDDDDEDEDEDDDDYYYYY